MRPPRVGSSGGYVSRMDGAIDWETAQREASRNSSCPRLIFFDQDFLLVQFVYSHLRR
jgi:hypothetical protein